jgi:hypothetical protein
MLSSDNPDLTLQVGGHGSRRCDQDVAAIAALANVRRYLLEGAIWSPE